MKKTYTIHMLVKVGQAEHIQRLQSQGHIYSNTVEFFRNIEGHDVVRKDSREGATASINVNNFKIFIGPEKEELNGAKFTNVKMYPYNEDDLQSHLYCLFAIKPEHVTGKAFFDERNLEFGDKALIITDVPEFISRFKNCAKANNIAFENNVVQYYNNDNTYQRLTIFNKPNNFEYQNEYRFHIKNRSNKPLEFYIGSLEDISVLIDAGYLAEALIKEQQKL